MVGVELSELRFKVKGTCVCREMAPQKASGRFTARSTIHETRPHLRNVSGTLCGSE